MPNQYIIVNFPEDRVVLSGGTEVGDTNMLLPINAGTHTFTLSDPQDYTPPSQKLRVANTSVAKPFNITFTQNAPGPVGGAGGAGGAGPAVPP